MKNYLTQNAKIKKMSGDKTFNWGIPAYKSKSGMLTCPWAGTCAKGCYARAGAYVWSHVSQAFERRLELALSPEFVDTIDAEIKRRKVKRLRIHDSGDFFSGAYRDSWLEIIRRNPDTKFYAYTKAIPLFRHLKLPENFSIVFSEGGKLDAWIDRATMPHSRVFEAEADLLKAGYINGTADDNVAASGVKNVGLVFHGPKSRKFTTGESKHA